MNPAEEWMNIIEERFGKINYIHKIRAENSKPEIFVFFFENLPENALTAITFGLSDAEREEWKYGKPELIVTLDTKDKSWGLAAAYFASYYWGVSNFCYGEVFTMPERISSDSDMNGYFIFAPSFLNQEQATIKISDRTIHLAGLYPIYKEEKKLYYEIGLEKFWHLDGFELYNTSRKNLGK